MELPEIKSLLKKYEEGATSLSDEQRLKEELQKYKDEPSLYAYRQMFLFFEKEQSVTLPDKEPVFNREKPSVIWMLGIAASIAILIGVFVNSLPSEKEELGTYEDPEIAMQKTKEVLHLVARYMNHGAQDLKYLDEFEKTKNKIITIK
ncbi:hypothetical protein NBT05_17730 [Aquimarina sp. ERC-38]|uniref:hypothetical protein n=1 Tax=Aquimarina sp. ERC-38 TaxID=2949996 RepID=UPI0022461330|nr:hypothetical protein [Aquimarina sp. ERC-38]UZO80765.1 hypothetical protein NBT05_17730 [Aquimarina sp. ERC-38]